jgi:DNA-binding protein H-NS
MADVVAEVLRKTEELEALRREAIQELLRQRREVVKDIDNQLAKLGYSASDNTTSTVFIEGGKTRKKRGPMSEEHKRKIAESRARNKAAKAGGGASEPDKAPRLKKGGESSAGG